MSIESEEREVADPPARVPVIEIFEDIAGLWRFRLVAVNYEIVCQSEGYTEKGSAIVGANTMQHLAAKAHIVEVGS